MAGAENRTGLGLWHWTLLGLAVLALKQGYALAGAGQLQWLLAPLAGTLNLVGGLAFAPLPDGTWLDAGQRVLLVKACAGGNFLLTAWLAWVWRWRERAAPLATVLNAAAAAWVTALVANALRILLAVHAQDGLARLGGLTPAESHRLIGIAVYFLCLWVLLARPGRVHGALMAAGGLYLGVNLMLPILRAWWLGLPAIDPGHLAWTAGVPLGVAGCALLVQRCRVIFETPERQKRICPVP
jgi:exosortase K